MFEFDWEKYIISGFADEIDPALDVQLECVKRLGMTHICLRAADGKGIAEYTVEEIKENILPRLQGAFHDGCPAIGIDGGGGSHLAGTHGIIQGLDLGILYAVGAAFAPEIHGQQHGLNIQFRQHSLGQVACGVGDDLILHNVPPVEKTGQFRFLRM